MGIMNGISHFLAPFGDVNLFMYLWKISLWATVVLQCIPYSKRPLYCCSMEGLVICFSGLKSREEMVLFLHLFQILLCDCLILITSYNLVVCIYK